MENQYWIYLSLWKECGSAPGLGFFLQIRKGISFMSATKQKIYKVPYAAEWGCGEQNSPRGWFIDKAVSLKRKSISFFA